MSLVARSRRGTRRGPSGSGGGYERPEPLRIILRSGIIALRSPLAAAGRCVLVCCLVTSDGIGGTVPLGDGCSGVAAGLGSGRGATGSGMVASFRNSGQRAAAPAATADRIGGQPERCGEGRACALTLADAQQCRRRLLVAAA